MRLRLGMTQGQLADVLQVDQGTISRWERGVESPRPARQAEIQKLFSQQQNQRAVLRNQAILQQDWLPSTFLDSKLRLTKMSASAKKHYMERGQDPDALFGMSLGRYTDRSGLSAFYQKIVESGLLSGDLLLLRFVRNHNGLCHSAVYEPVMEGTELAGVLCYATNYFNIANAPGHSIELVEAIPLEDPSRVDVLHRGRNADAVIKALGELSNNR